MMSLEVRGDTRVHLLHVSQKSVSQSEEILMVLHEKHLVYQHRNFIVNQEVMQGGSYYLEHSNTTEGYLLAE